MSKESNDGSNPNNSKLEDIPLKDIAKVLQSGGRITRSIKSQTSLRSNEPIETRTKEKSKILLKYLGEPCLKTYLKGCDISYNNFIVEDYFLNKKLKRLHKYNLPENCIFFQRGFNNASAVKLVKLIQKKSKSNEYMIEERDQNCKNPQVRSISNYVLDNGILTVGQTLVFVSVNFQQFQRLFQDCLLDFKKKLQKIRLEELSQMQMFQQKQEKNQFASLSEMIDQNQQAALKAQNMDIEPEENNRVGSQRDIKEQSQSIKKLMNSQESLEIVERLNTQIKQLDLKIFQRLAGRNKLIMWPSVVLQPLIGQKSQLLELLKIKNDEFSCNDGRSQFLQARLDYRILQMAFDQIRTYRKDTLGEKQLENELTLAAKIESILDYVSKNNQSEIITHLIGTQTTRLISNHFMKWDELCQEDLDYLIVKSPLRLLIDEINTYIRGFNNFKAMEFSPLEGKHSYFRLCRYENQLGQTQLCIPIRSDQTMSNNQKKVLIRLLRDQVVQDAQAQLLRWVQQSKLRVNLTIPRQNETQKKFYYLLGNSISLQEGINCIYYDFYYQNIDFNTVLRKCSDQQKIKMTVIKQQRCIYCYYTINDPKKCYRCKFCLKFCHQECSFNQNKPNSDTEASMIPLSIFQAKSDEQVWTCEQCSPCNECKMSVKKNYLKCTNCNSLFHQTCGKLKGISQNWTIGCKYTCQNCLKCRMCSNRLKNQDYIAMDKDIFCTSCYTNYMKNEYCAICMKQMPGKWVQCDKTECKKWIHIICDNYFKDKETKSGLEKANYSCPFCRLNQKRKIYKWIVDQLKVFDEFQYFYEAEYQEITGYTQVIQNPICLYKMKEKVIEGAYDQKPYQLIKADLELLVDNALKFNMPKDQPHYRAKILLIVGSRFLQCMQDLLECNQEFIVNENPQEIFTAKKKKFYIDLYQNYLSYLLNYKSQKTVIEVKRNSYLPFEQQFFSSKIILNNSFASSELIMRIKKKPHTIQNLFNIPRLSSSCWGPIRTKICYYHPQSGYPIIFECTVCKQFYCCTTRCLKHDTFCSICQAKGCACDSSRCGCPLIRDKEKKQLQSRIQLTLSEQKLQKREYTEYYKYCLKCVTQNLKTHWCYLCKFYCYFGYEKCNECSKFYHLNCEKKTKWEESSMLFLNKLDFKNSFSNRKLPNLCNVCSTSQKYTRLLKETLQKEIKAKACQLNTVFKYLAVFNYIYEQNGIRLNNQEVTGIVLNNFNDFLEKQEYFTDFLENFSTIIEAIGNNKITRDEFRQHFMGEIGRKIANQNSHSHERGVSFTETREMKELKQSKKYFKIYSKRFNNHYYPVNFANNYEIKCHLQHLTSKLTNYMPLQFSKDSLNQNMVNEHQMVNSNYNRQESHFNFKNFERIKIEVITSYVSPKSKKNIYYTTKIEKFKSFLNFLSYYYIFRESQEQQFRRREEREMLSEDVQNTKRAEFERNRNIQKEYERYLRFHADHQNLTDCIYKEESSKSLLFEEVHEQIFNPFLEGNYTARYSTLSDHKTQDFSYINNKSEMLFKYLSNFCLKIFEQNKIVLKKGNTNILSETNKSWRIIKKYNNKNLQIKLEKRDEHWLFYINDGFTIVKSISDIVRKVSTEVSPHVTTFEDLAEFLGFNMTDSNYYEPNHFTLLLQTLPLDSLKRNQRKTEVLKIYNQYKWGRQGNFKIEKEEQGVTKSYDYNVTKKQIFYLKKRNQPSAQFNLVEPKAVPFITFDDIKKDLEGLESITKEKDNFAIRQPTNDVYIAPSKIDRLGLFIRNFTRKNSIVTEYIGQIISEATADMREQKFHFGCYMFGLTKNNTRLQIIDATFVGNMGRYLNHSCDPNCKARIEMVNGQPRIFIYTIKDVLANEELTYDYQFKVDTNDRLTCKCKAPNCQGRLT